MLTVNKRLARSVGAASAIVLGAFALASCSTDSGADGGASAAPDGDSCEIASEITIGVVNEQSGPVAYAGIGP